VRSLVNTCHIPERFYKVIVHEEGLYVLPFYLFVVFVLPTESGFCTRQCCGPSRGFVMHISDNYSQVVFPVARRRCV